MAISHTLDTEGRGAHVNQPMKCWSVRAKRWTDRSVARLRVTGSRNAALSVAGALSCATASLMCMKCASASLYTLLCCPSAPCFSHTLMSSARLRGAAKF